jgi:hypothetical protein
MFDKLADAGSALDWITPLITLIRDVRNRPSVGYSVPVAGGWSAYAVSDLLKDHGIKHWGLTIFKETIMFRLRVPQAQYAQYLFEQNRIVYYGGVDTAAANHSRRAAPASAAPAASGGQTRTLKPGNLLSDSLNSIDRFIDRLPGP